MRYDIYKSQIYICTTLLSHTKLDWELSGIIYPVFAYAIKLKIQPSGRRVHKKRDNDFMIKIILSNDFTTHGYDHGSN